MKKDKTPNSEITTVVPNTMGILAHLILVTIIILFFKSINSPANILEGALILSIVFAEWFFVMGCIRTKTVYNPNSNAIEIIDDFLKRIDIFPLSGINSISYKKIPLLMGSSVMTIKTTDGEKFNVYLVNTTFAKEFVSFIKGLLKDVKSKKEVVG